MREEDHKQFFTAMEVELADHEECNHWTLMERKDLPIGTKTIMAIWSFKRKRFPDGTLNKHKARLCAHSGQQTWGLDYWDTYAPVVTWASVPLLLIVAKIHGLQSKSIDFVLLFHKQTWMYQCSWNSLLASILSMFWMKIDVVIFSKSTKACMVSSKPATIGSKSFEKDWSPRILFRVKPTSVYSFRRIALSWPTLTTASFLETQCQVPMQLSILTCWSSVISTYQSR